MTGASVRSRQLGRQGGARLVRRPLPGRECVKMPTQRVPVTSHRRPGQGPPRPERSHVVDRRPGQGQEGLEIEPGRRGHPLDLAQEGHHVVGRDAGGSVVGGPIGVVHLDHTSTQGECHPAGHGLAAHGEGHAGGQTGGPDDGVRKRDQRMEGGPAGVRRQRLEPEGPRQVQDGRPRLRGHRGGDGGHYIVGRGDDQDIYPGCGEGEVIMTTEESDDIPTERRKRCSQRRSGPPGTDDTDGLHETPFGVPAPLGCRSPTDDRNN